MESMYRFVLWLVPTVEKFPRRQKFLLGDRLPATALDVIERLVGADIHTRSPTASGGGELRDPNAYGVWIRGDSMLPAHQPAMVAIVSPGCLVRDGDEVYAHLVSGERLVRVVHPVTGGFVLEPYNPAYTVRWVKKTEVEALHIIVYSRRRES